LLSRLASRWQLRPPLHGRITEALALRLLEWFLVPRRKDIMDTDTAMAAMGRVMVVDMATVVMVVVMGMAMDTAVATVVMAINTNWK
jgi:hypothetical protein